MNHGNYMNQKIDNQLNLALDIPPDELNKSQELRAGFDDATDSWDLIVKYTNLDEVRKFENIIIKELSGGYAILNVPRNMVNYISDLDGIIYVEKPKRLEYAVIDGKRESCINQLQQENLSDELFGEGVIIGIADSGIDFTNRVFCNQDNTTRILKLWDQVTDIVYDENDINRALTMENPYSVVDSRDPTGHGTHIAGIAAGNFAENKNDNLGIATKSKLIVVKMATANENSFPRTPQLMEAIDFIVKQSNLYNMPLSLNISFGNNYGSHDGTSLLSTYIDSVINDNRISVQIGSGNEGDSSGHAGGFIKENDVEEIEFQVSRFQRSFSIQLWKDYSDDFEIQIIAPSGDATELINNVEISNSYMLYVLNETNLYVIYGEPRPYSRYQEIYMDFIPANSYLNDGIWTIRLYPRRIVYGRYDLWLPNSSSLNVNTRFLRPDNDTTLTVPSATTKAITVGAYNSRTGSVASFSGRGYTRENKHIKPDLVAPGVDISSAAVGGGDLILSGTSIATPFVTGAAALMMEWGIVRGNDNFLYGEKIKAYLIKGARQLDSYDEWPNTSAGWGALCLKDSFPK